MAATVAGAQIITQGDTAVIDRVQTAGPSDVTISREKIYELGNDKSIGSTTGTPEVTYNVESLDVSTEFEVKLIGGDPDTFPSTPGSNEIDFKDAIPIDMLNLFKEKKRSNDITSGVIVPYASLSSVTYSFGVSANASQSFTLNADTQLITPGQPYAQQFTNTGVGPYTISRTADLYSRSGESIYILSVKLEDSVTGLYKRVFYDASGTSGYTNSTTSFTLPEDESAMYDTVKVTYSSATKTPYDEDGVGPNGQSVHKSTLLVPAAVRSENIEIWLGSADATPVWTKMTAVQSLEATWSVTPENGEELGNPYFTYSEYDVPDVSGSIGIKPISTYDLARKLSQFTGTPTNEVIGPESTVPVQIEARIKHPDTGNVLKTIYVPDARFDVPGFQGQVQTRLENTLNYTSDGGEMFIYNGSRV